MYLSTESLCCCFGYSIFHNKTQTHNCSTQTFKRDVKFSDRWRCRTIGGTTRTVTRPNCLHTHTPWMSNTHEVFTKQLSVNVYNRRWKDQTDYCHKSQTSGDVDLIHDLTSKSQLTGTHTHTHPLNYPTLLHLLLFCVQGSIQQLLLKSDVTAPDDQCEEDDPYVSVNTHTHIDEH